MEERVGALLNLQRFGGKRVCWSFEMGIKMNSQARVQNEINLHNQETSITNPK
jgi:hypothetical protein